MPEEKTDRQKLVNYLKDHGWNDEKANQFLDDEVGIRVLSIPGKCLLDVLKEVCQEGIPYGNVTVEFLVPHSNWEAFQSRAEQAINNKGGFLLTDDENDNTVKTDSKVAH